MRRLLVLLCLTVGCSADMMNGQTEDMAAHGDAGGVSDLAACAYVSVSPSSGIAPQTLVARADVTTLAAPTWLVSTPSGFVTPAALDASGLRVSIVADKPGTYTFHVEFEGGYPCPSEASAVLQAPTSVAQAYRVRLTPPGSTGLPQQDRLFSLFGATSLTAQNFTLDSGAPVGGVLRGPGGTGIAGEVVLAPDDGPELRVVVPPSGSFGLPVQLSSTYRLVLIPADPQLAPRMLGPLSGVALQSAAFSVGIGEPVGGMVRDDLASPIAKAAIALRYNALPSGLGRSAADGSYALRAEAGTYGLGASAPGWPDLALGGIPVAAGGATLNVDYTVARLAVSLRVVRADGSTPVGGALVSLRSTAIPGAATIGTAAGPRPAQGIAQAQGTTASDGTLSGLLLPAATYDVLVGPGASADDARTGLRVVINAAGEIVVQLAPRPTLSGVVRDTAGAPVADARVRVRSRGVVVETKTDAEGAYALPVDAGLPLEVLFLPPAGTALASARAAVGALDGPLGITLPASLDAVLPPGLPVSGQILGPSGNVLPGVAIDVLCATCGDPRPLAHAESTVGGVYQLFLQDPGTTDFDAGTD